MKITNLQNINYTKNQEDLWVNGEKPSIKANPRWQRSQNSLDTWSQAQRRTYMRVSKKKEKLLKKIEDIKNK